ncbi:MAG: ATP-binding cassette domain-containing protein [Treponema sp.]|jgi:oligopeptide/dipeptide ABC transporter ATP-binding protein|nr:ATP-binding cassette domain-containing protein [Treponema sp.]
MDKALLDVRHLRTWFPVKSGVLRKTVGHVHAVEDISFTLKEEEVFALVGESGCGKSTAGASILRLIEPSGGEVFFGGLDITKLSAGEMRLRRREMQLIFQNPYSSLNPRMNVRTLLSEPLRVHFRLSEGEIREKTEEILSLVGLAKDQLDRYPHQFSGGQKQRISIARALVSRPRFVIADEPVSALDVSIQAQILNLLMRLREEMKLSLVFISHDLNVVRHISDRIAVMYLGLIMEQGDTEGIYRNPLHPYTRALLSAVPSHDPLEKKQRVVLQGDVPNPANPPPGCPFAPRCGQAMERCREKRPEVFTPEKNHQVACHLAADHI